VPAKPELTPVTPFCSIERALVLLSDRWSFLVVREILLYGETRFSALRDRLGIASNVLTDRLDRLVDGGVLEKRAYKEAGSRARSSYHPTPAGLDLKLALAALQQWGDVHEPRADGPTVARRRVSDGASVDVAFVADGTPLPVDEMEFRPTAAYPVHSDQ
jgi:DNA-binding HxlR family transcriptional regulator